MELFTGMLLGFILAMVFCAVICKDMAIINGTKGNYFCTFQNRLYRLRPDSNPDVTPDQAEEPKHE